MLYYDFTDYEDFQERFGIIHHGNGTKNRKNKILLAYIKNKDLLHQARVTNDYSLLHISSMSELKQVMMKRILNISCGYYQPHTDQEFTIKSELQNCLAFVCHIIEKCQKKYPHIDNSYGCFGMSWRNYDRNYQKEDEYWEMYEIISDYLNYQPGLPADLFYESYKDSYPSLTKDDYFSIVNELESGGCIEKEPTTPKTREEVD